MTDFCKGISPVKFEEPNSANPLAYRHYNKDEMVLGKRTEDHIRPPSPIGTPSPGKVATRSAGQAQGRRNGSCQHPSFGAKHPPAYSR